MKTIVFDLWGDWAHFKKFYTTASPLSFHFPPITALKGIIGSILGLSKDKSEANFYLKELEGLYCAIQLMKPVKTFRIGSNWIETKKARYLSRIASEKGRYQTIIELIKDPFYRIYVAHPENNALFEKLAELLKEHKSIYTPYLGITEHIANFKFVEETIAHVRDTDAYTTIHSVISAENLKQDAGPAVQIQEGLAYQRDRIPVSMDEHRMVIRYESVLYEMKAFSVTVKPVQYWELENGSNIHFFR